MELSSSHVVIDSTATKHMSSERFLFEDYAKFSTPKPIYLGDDRDIMVGEGRVSITMFNGERVTLSSVYFVPSLAKNMLSVKEAALKGVTVNFKGTECTLEHKNYAFGKGKLCGSLYYLIGETERNSVNVAKGGPARETLGIWHCRMGHLNQQDVRKLAKDLATGIFVKGGGSIDLCDNCIKPLCLYHKG